MKSLGEPSDHDASLSIVKGRGVEGREEVNKVER